MVHVDEASETVAVFFADRDRPVTCRLLRAITDGRTLDGFTPEIDGVWVSWEMLATSTLSDGEKAAVHVAKGVAALERVGGLSGPLAESVHDAVAVLCPYPSVYDRVSTPVTKRTGAP